MRFLLENNAAPPGTTGGFTLIEAAVILAILTMISAVVLANFPSIRFKTALLRSAQDLVLTLRQSQNDSFAVRRVLDDTNPQNPKIVVPAGFGVYLTTGATSYTVFADLNGNGKYESSNDKNRATVNLPSGTSIGDVCVDIDTFNACGISAVSIVFAVPLGDVAIRTPDNSAHASAKVVLTSPFVTYRREIKIYLSGQVSQGVQ